jgi:hypothetical protein
VLKRGYERGGLALRLRHFETALEEDGLPARPASL